MGVFNDGLGGIGVVPFREGSHVLLRALSSIPSSSPWLWKKSPTVTWIWITILDSTYRYPIFAML